MLSRKTGTDNNFTTFWQKQNLNGKGVKKIKVSVIFFLSKKFQRDFPSYHGKNKVKSAAKSSDIKKLMNIGCADY